MSTTHRFVSPIILLLWGTGEGSVESPRVVLDVGKGAVQRFWYGWKM